MGGHGLCASGVSASSRPHYESRRSKKTGLYRIVQENLETFHHQVEMEIGYFLLELVGKKFDAFL